MTVVQKYLDIEYKELVDKELDIKSELETVSIHIDQFDKKIKEFIDSDEKDTGNFFFASSSYIDNKEFAMKELDSLKEEQEKLITEKETLLEELNCIEEKKTYLKDIILQCKKDYESILDSNIVTDNIKQATDIIRTCIDKTDFVRKIMIQDSKRASNELDKIMRTLNNVDKDLSKIVYSDYLEDISKKGEYYAD